MTQAAHEILKLKGELSYSPALQGGSPPRLKPGQTVSSEHLRKLAGDLCSVLKDWNFALLKDRVLVTADYSEIVAKSNRLTCLLRPRGCAHLSDLIKGARFETALGESRPHHVIAYLVPPEAIERTIDDLENAAQYADEFMDGIVWDTHLDQLLSTARLKAAGLSRSKFRSLIKDACYVTGFRIASADTDEAEDSERLVSLYRVGTRADLIALLSRAGIRISPEKFINDDTLLMSPAERALLGDAAGWLVAMEVRDLMSLDYEAAELGSISAPAKLPEPSDEPIIGVIDTRFDESAYFSDWVEYHDCIPSGIPAQPRDYRHGTSVSSLIVNGHLINQGLDDGCGLFRVRHFAVVGSGAISTYMLLKNIQRIVRENPDIKVWNLSLGSSREINENFISPEAAELDRLQRKYDILFVVAGTNRPASLDDSRKPMRIGTPADSILSLVVNACDRSKAPAPYSRCGPVLNFFIKPDVAAFGGTNADRLYACTPAGREPMSGTSFAAPWAARKAAYLIHKLQLSRTEAKALLIDAAVGWNQEKDSWPYLGYGALPHHIQEITAVPRDEIRFMISGIVADYETYRYDLPFPTNSSGKFDYSVRATLCCFPECRREQGIDYTLTELDLHFGRVDDRKKDVLIRGIDDNLQSEDVRLYMPEGKARVEFRKWDPVKVKAYVSKRDYSPLGLSGSWGFKIFAKERLSEKHGCGLPFTAVVTLKARSGDDRQAAFVKACQAKGWLVQTVNVENRLKITAKLNEDIQLG